MQKWKAAQVSLKMTTTDRLSSLQNIRNVSLAQQVMTYSLNCI